MLVPPHQPIVLATCATARGLDRAKSVRSTCAEAKRRASSSWATPAVNLYPMPVAREGSRASKPQEQPFPFGMSEQT